MHGLGLTQPNYMGWAQPSPCEQCPPLFTCYVNTGGVAGMKQEKREREKGWPAVAAVIDGAAGGDKQRHWWFAVVAAALFFSFLLSLSSVFRSLPYFFFSFLFSFALPPLFSTLSLLFCSFLFFALSSPVFIGKNQGRERLGWLMRCRPSNTWKALGKWGSLVGIFFMLLRRRKSVKTGGRKIFFFPCFARLREEEDPQCRSKRHRFSPFFLLEQCMKWCRFGQNASFHLKEKGGKLMSKSKSVFNL